eukprot:163946-Prorocentrum_minimum.AAC.2
MMRNPESGVRAPPVGAVGLLLEFSLVIAHARMTVRLTGPRVDYNPIAGWDSDFVASIIRDINHT